MLTTCLTRSIKPEIKSMADERPILTHTRRAQQSTAHMSRRKSAARVPWPQDKRKTHTNLYYSCVRATLPDSLLFVIFVNKMPLGHHNKGTCNMSSNIREWHNTHAHSCLYGWTAHFGCLFSASSILFRILRCVEATQIKKKWKKTKTGRIRTLEFIGVCVEQ